MVIVIAVRVWVVGEFYLVEVASGAGAGMQETDLLFGQWFGGGRGAELGADGFVLFGARAEVLTFSRFSLLIGCIIDTLLAERCCESRLLLNLPLLRINGFNITPDSFPGHLRTLLGWRCFLRIPPLEYFLSPLQTGRYVHPNPVSKLPQDPQRLLKGPQRLILGRLSKRPDPTRRIGDPLHNIHHPIHHIPLHPVILPPPFRRHLGQILMTPHLDPTLPTNPNHPLTHLKKPENPKQSSEATETSMQKVQ
jgi:hypothetical protein